MKKVSTVGGQAEQEFFSAEADDRFGSGRSEQLLLHSGGDGPNRDGEQSFHAPQCDEGSRRGDAAQPDGPGDRDALTLGKPATDWVGHEVIVAHAQKVRLIGESRRKDDRLDAQTLARLARIDPGLLSPVKHRSAKAQADLTVIRARPDWCEHGRRW